MKNNLTIRNVVKNDNKKLAIIIRNTFEEFNAPRTGTVYNDPTTDNLYKLFDSERAVLWVAEFDKKLVGCCGVYPTPGLEPGYAELVKFYLAPEARGKGIGRELMKKTIESAKLLGYKKLYLESFPHFATAVGMYKNAGFVSLDAPMGNSGHTSCNIWMIKEL